MQPCANILLMLYSPFTQAHLGVVDVGLLSITTLHAVVPVAAFVACPANRCSCVPFCCACTQQLCHSVATDKCVVHQQQKQQQKEGSGTCVHMSS
jgi:hypothetical protein